MKRIGIFLESLSLDDTFAFARLADERGFDSAWFPEITWSDAFSLATAAAMGTKRIKLATGVVGIFSRSPALMAMSIAGLDELSGGRAVLGLGTQAKTYVELWHSAKFEKPVARMREYVTALRKILQNPFNLTSYKGRIFDIQGFVLTVKPKAQRIPIYVAAIGPQMEGAERSGRDLKSENFDIAVGFPALVSDSDQRYEMIKPIVAVFTVAVGSSPFYRTILEDLGFSENVKAVTDRMMDGDVEGAVKHIPDEMARQVTLCGTSSEIRHRINEYRSAGVTLPLLNPTPPYAYYPLFPKHLPEKLGAGRFDYEGLREQVRSVIVSASD